MQVRDDISYFVIPLSVQVEGNDYLVGNTDIEEFYQFEAPGLWVIQRLQEGLTISAIRELIITVYPEPIDVDSFIELLLEIGFILPEDRQSLYHDRVKELSKSRLFSSKVSQRIASWIFSAGFAGVGAVIILWATYLLIKNPDIRPHISAFYFERYQTLALLSLLGLNALSTLIHELGHMLAAARWGVASKFGFGNRLWSIVAESDLSGIMALPRKQRYLPLLAGMLADLLTLSLITGILRFVLPDEHPFLISLFKAWFLQIFLTMLWQCNIFLKTDFYFVLCNYWSFPNLDSAARVYIKDKIHMFSLGLFGRKSIGSPSKKSVLRIFSLVWLLGRIFSIGMLFIVLIPTLGRYAQHSITVMKSSDHSILDKLDIGFAFGVYALIFILGIVLWVKSHLQKSREVLYA